MHVGLIPVNLQCLAYLIASASDQVKQHVADMNSMFVQSLSVVSLMSPEDRKRLID